MSPRRANKIKDELKKSTLVYDCLIKMSYLYHGCMKNLVIWLTEIKEKMLLTLASNGAPTHHWLVLANVIIT